MSKALQLIARYRASKTKTNPEAWEAFYAAATLEAVGQREEIYRDNERLLAALKAFTDR